MKLGDLTLQELLFNEKACRIICERYEKQASEYSMTHNFLGNNSATEEFTELNVIYKKYHDKYEKILNEIEKRLENV